MPEQDRVIAECVKQSEYAGLVESEYPGGSRQKTEEPRTPREWIRQQGCKQRDQDLGPFAAVAYIQLGAWRDDAGTLRGRPNGGCQHLDERDARSHIDVLDQPALESRAAG